MHDSVTLVQHIQYVELTNFQLVGVDVDQTSYCYVLIVELCVELYAVVSSACPQASVF